MFYSLLLRLGVSWHFAKLFMLVIEDKLNGAERLLRLVETFSFDSISMSIINIYFLTITVNIVSFSNTQTMLSHSNLHLTFIL